MKRALLCVALTVNAGCAPVAVGCVVAGAGSLVGAHALTDDHCGGSEGCVYSNVLALFLGMIGVGLLLGGGIDLAVRQSQSP